MSEIESIQLCEIDTSYIDKTIRTFGWVLAVRTAGRAGTFIDLFFGGKTLKCLCPNTVLSQALTEYEKRSLDTDSKVDSLGSTLSELKVQEESEHKSEPKNDKKGSSGSLAKTDLCTNLLPHSSLYIDAKILPNASKRDSAKHAIEAHVVSMNVYRLSPHFPLNAHSSPYTRLQLGHLALRTPERVLFLQARSELLHQFRSFYRNYRYVEITPPTLVQTQVEGGATLFSLDYYGKPAFLTQSSQLYLETAVASCGKVFCIMPSYRAEKFNTTRHLSEYTHIEGELSNITFDGLMDEIESMVKFVLTGFISEMKDRILEVSPKYEHASKSEIVSKSFIRMRYSEAIVCLIENKIYKDKENNIPYTMGDDISDRDEVALVSIHNDTPIFLTHFPVEHKPFYVRKTEYIDNIISNFSVDSSFTTLRSDRDPEYLNNNDLKAFQNNECAKSKTNQTSSHVSTEDKAISVNRESCDYTMKSEFSSEKISYADSFPNNIVSDVKEGFVEKLSGYVTDSCDLLWPGIGEILGGSMRCEKHKELMEGFKREGIDPSNYYWYTDLRVFGADKHGGYGLGFERLLKAVMDYKNVNEACLYPRFPGRCEP